MYNVFIIHQNDFAVLLISFLTIESIIEKNFPLINVGKKKKKSELQ